MIHGTSALHVIRDDVSGATASPAPVEAVRQSRRERRRPKHGVIGRKGEANRRVIDSDRFTLSSDLPETPGLELSYHVTKGWRWRRIPVSDIQNGFAVAANMLASLIGRRAA